MYERWNKFTHVCESCDALIEYTSTRIVSEITCECGAKCNWLSQEPATITPTTTEEEQMETATIGSDALHSPEVEYNPNLLVTYKVLHGYSDPEFTTSKVTSLEWDLHNGRQSQKTVGLLQSKINTVKDIITEAYADSDDKDTLQQIAEALNIELMRTVEWTATIEVSGSYEYDILSEYDYDLDGEITDNLYVDSQNGAITIGDIEVCNVREAY
jgi:hypothetical protein